MTFTRSHPYFKSGSPIEAKQRVKKAEAKGILKQAPREKKRQHRRRSQASIYKEFVCISLKSKRRLRVCIKRIRSVTVSTRSHPVLLQNKKPGIDRLG